MKKHVLLQILRNNVRAQTRRPSKTPSMQIQFFYIYALRFDTLRFATGVGLEKVRILFFFVFYFFLL